MLPVLIIQYKYPIPIGFPVKILTKYPFIPLLCNFHFDKYIIIIRNLWML
jgi:hypothetical protein